MAVGHKTCELTACLLYGSLVRDHDNDNMVASHAATVDFRLDADSKMVDEWTRTTLFPKVKFLYEDGDLDVGGQLYKFFARTCHNTHVDLLSEIGGSWSQKTMYREQLWKFCVPRIRKNLSVKRSGVTNQMGGKFMGKYLPSKSGAVKFDD